MKVWTKLYKNNKIISSHTAISEKTIPSDALLDCMEQCCKRLDLAEPVWVSKHTKDLSVFHRTKLLPEDFMEAVNFDYCVVEIID